MIETWKTKVAEAQALMYFVAGMLARDTDENVRKTAQELRAAAEKLNFLEDE